MAVSLFAGRPRPRVRELATQAAVVVVGTAVAVVAAVPDLDRYVVVLAALTVVAAVAAAVLPWRLTGTVTVLAATLTVLLAGTLDTSDVRPVQAVTDAALLMLLVAVLGAREDRSSQSPHAASVRAAVGAGPRGRPCPGARGRFARRPHGGAGRRTLGAVGPRRPGSRGGRPRRRGGSPPQLARCGEIVT